MNALLNFEIKKVILVLAFAFIAFVVSAQTHNVYKVVKYHDRVAHVENTVVLDSAAESLINEFDLFGKLCPQWYRIDVEIDSAVVYAENPSGIDSTFKVYVESSFNRATFAKEDSVVFHKTQKDTTFVFENDAATPERFFRIRVTGKDSVRLYFGDVVAQFWNTL